MIGLFPGLDSLYGSRMCTSLAGFIPVLGAACSLVAVLVGQACGVTNRVVEVRARPLALKGRSDSVADALARHPHVALRRQGGANVQADITIRGSSFSQTGLLVEGVALRHAQTEHFHAELPVPASVFGQPMVLTGLEQVRRSTVHPAGGVALNIRDAAPGGYLDLGWGDGGSSWQSAFLEGVRETPAGGTVGVTGFGYYEDARGLDYPDNDMRWRGAGTVLKTEHGNWSSAWLVGTARKAFGARGYYGVNPAWPADETFEDTLFLGSVRCGDVHRVYRRFTGLWRATRDEYSLLIDPSNPYRNRHRSRMTTIACDGRERLGDAWRLQWRGVYAYEGIAGNNLGEHDRERYTLLALPEWQYRGVRISAGVMSETFSDGHTFVLPQVGITWQVGGRQELYAAYTETVREPSYTELNYASPGSLGNAGLTRGRVRTSECGWRFGARHDKELSVAVFHRDVDNAVDWVKLNPDDARWNATDLGSVSTWGMECSGAIRIGRLTVRGAYTWLEKAHAPGVYAARYVLDYPAHRATVNVDWPFAAHWRLCASQSYRYHGETAARASDTTEADGRLSLQWYPARPDGLVVRVGVANLWNDPFGSYVDLPAPSRRGWVMLSWQFE